MSAAPVMPSQRTSGGVPLAASGDEVTVVAGAREEGEARPSGGLLWLSGALPLELLGVTVRRWGLPVQIRHAVDDPFRRQGWIDAVAADAARAGGRVETLDHPGTGHRFTDPSLPAEYDPAAGELLRQRALAFLGRRPADAETTLAR
ncbi:hypothetical protein [Geodermatophilus saharensis]|uniref:hypothetical protein n=1 Tax=Geodermatophilus saharensis TaxID=1137994 RepID=UPI00113FCBAD|nr:hypothetical protein [Geodermatophilus saharensis]